MILLSRICIKNGAPWGSLLDGDKGLYWQNKFVHHKLSLLFIHFINTTYNQLGIIKSSSPPPHKRAPWAHYIVRWKVWCSFFTGLAVTAKNALEHLHENSAASSRRSPAGSKRIKIEIYLYRLKLFLGKKINNWRLSKCKYNFPISDFEI